MSPKQRKPSRQKKQTSSDSSADSPIHPTNYREIHQNEVEALRSIYGDDFEEVENKRSAWQVGLLPGAGLVLADSDPAANLQCHIQTPPAILVKSRCHTNPTGGTAGHLS